MILNSDGVDLVAPLYHVEFLLLVRPYVHKLIRTAADQIWRRNVFRQSSSGQMGKTPATSDGLSQNGGGDKTAAFRNMLQVNSKDERVRQMCCDIQHPPSESRSFLDQNSVHISHTVDFNILKSFKHSNGNNQTFQITCDLRQTCLDPRFKAQTYNSHIRSLSDPIAFLQTRTNARLQEIMTRISSD